ncbi:hypothetical protein FCM35_KLT14996 [Carex littledalei]|uniref:Uncharacterized protein n=1 Tax=Carex littledalei TaxID=544730 RepID=A0A833V2D7_9POAL|nr:hypothetical protein FCM35_KLT14996 [Carex littledalei]
MAEDWSVKRLEAFRSLTRVGKNCVHRNMMYHPWGKSRCQVTMTRNALFTCGVDLEKVTLSVQSLDKH